MALIEWSNSLSVNIQEIDKQHHKLVDMINNLYDAMKQGKGKEVVGKIISEMVSYTITHFKLEERYFEQFGYPDAAAHKAKHKDFVDKVTTFKNDYQSGKLSMTIEVMNYLSDWLQKHIKGTDKEYAPFLIQKGIS